VKNTETFAETDKTTDETEKKVKNTGKEGTEEMSVKPTEKHGKSLAEIAQTDEKLGGGGSSSHGKSKEDTSSIRRTAADVVAQSVAAVEKRKSPMPQAKIEAAPKSKPIARPPVAAIVEMAGKPKGTQFGIPTFRDGTFGDVIFRHDFYFGDRLFVDFPKNSYQGFTL
jgi:hypothetical protein